MRGQGIDHLLRRASDGDTVRGKAAGGKVKADVCADPRGHFTLPITDPQQEGFGPRFPSRGKVKKGAVLVKEQTLNVS